MELRQLRYFIEVAEREHVSEAALHLHVAQSAISKQISNLEGELGVTLFERDGRNVKLTQIGREFLKHAKIVIRSAEDAKKQIDEYLAPDRGTIKIGFPTSLSNHLLPSVISAFKEEYPNIAFQLRQGSYKFLIEAIKKGDIHVAFLGPAPKDDPDIESSILFAEYISALLPQTHALSNKKSLHLTDLKNDEFVSFPRGFVLEKIIMDACKQAGFVPKISSEGEDLDAIKGLVAAGIGVTLLPESTFQELTPRMTVKIPIDIPEIRRTVGVIKQKNKNLAPSEKVFYDFVIDFFSRLQQFQ
ncbi:LysR family transcriptional activator of glutamate synthase operon [Virgibacillus natechei]|uniref:LysR family transcriptional activator of glutamate synthase operon n=1 Tax=Virgibacillus natechei TaxID=1216297 RepID=A0ABS4ICA4_9BACI|nr:LysR family transcriptional regulator [Virgibacillus natechei]MBP1968533.1 LysR family transcriptional activator of glutamate synthase operon [Virgibacillus natechei]UZD13648.1 LysR family transcriptional regulator [Virgibacillus natechei]